MMKGEELDRLLESVRSNNLELQALKEKIKAEGFDLKSANTLDATSVEYSPFFRKGAAGVASSELIVSQELDFPTLYAARRQAGKKELELWDKRYMLADRDMMYQAAEQYLNLVRLSETGEALERQLGDARKTQALYAKMSEDGNATAVELNRINIRIMELNSALIANQTEMESVKSELKSLNGYQDFPFKEYSYPKWLAPEADSESVNSDSEVAVAGGEIESLQQQERVARQGWVPKLTLGYRRNTELDEASNGLIVGASFSLFSTSSQVKAARARKAAAEIEMDNTRKRVEAERKAARKELGMIAAAMKAYDMSLLDEGERLLNKALELGTMTMTDYYTEIESINEKRMSFIELRYEYYKRLCVLNKNTLMMR